MQQIVVGTTDPEAGDGSESELAFVPGQLRARFRSVYEIRLNLLFEMSYTRP